MEANTGITVERGWKLSCVIETFYFYQGCVSAATEVFLIFSVVACLLCTNFMKLALEIL